MAKHVLEGVRVLDFMWAGAGPLGTGLLAKDGAEVIKVESIKRLDTVRRIFLVGGSAPNNSAYFGTTSTSKYSITLNLADPRGVEIAKRLVGISDIVSENYRSGAIERMGLGYEVLKSIKPDIIMISSSILGQKGASRALAGGWAQGSSLSAHPYLTGWSDGPPLLDGTGYSDYVQSIFVVVALMIALDYRRRTGKGQHLDLSHVEPLVQFISPAILDYMASKRQQQRMGNRSLNAAPHGAFPCQGPDRWCVIAVSTDEEWTSFCRTIGNPPWSQDPKFATLTSRKKNEDELEGFIGEWTKNYPPEEVMHKLQQAGVPAGVVQDMSDIMERDPQVKARGAFAEVNHPAIGPYKFALPPFRLTQNSFKLFPAPLLGEHNDYIYRQLLGLSAEEITGLSKDGVLV